VVVREGTEGPYAGAGGSLHTGTSAEVATEESLNTRHGVERVIRDAFARARARERRRVTLVHKTNVLTHAGSLWARTFDAVRTDFPDVATEYQHVDAAAMFLVTRPQRYDVVVTDNLFGDIITDLAAAVTGGIGVAASGSINPERAHPSMFEPVHGSAPDIAGTGVADPVAAVLSAALMLEHLGYTEAAARITGGVAAELASRTPGAPLRTVEIGDRLATFAAG
jgi:3-isopropylmalate dehydrogenase